MFKTQGQKEGQEEERFQANKNNKKNNMDWSE